MTGESRPINKISESTYGAETFGKNIAKMGTLCINGRGKGIVYNTGERTELGKISQLIKDVEEIQTPLQEKMSEIGKQLSIVAISIVVVIFIVGALQQKSLLEMFTIGVSLAVAAIPEGLPIVVTVTLALGVTRMAKRRAIVRQLPAVEALGATTVICTDKTGTLTKNEITVTEVATVHNSYHVTGVGYDSKGSFYNSDSERVQVSNDLPLTELLQSGMLCNNSQFSYKNNKEGENSVHLIGQPTEGSLLICGFKAGLPDPRNIYNRIDESPFDSSSKIMIVKCHMGEEKGEWFHVKGAPEKIVERSRFYYNSNGEVIPLTESIKQDLLRKANEFGDKSLRTIGVAKGKLKEGYIFLGIMGMVDPPKHGVKQAIKRAIDSGVHVVMITGDSKATAMATAKELHILDEINPAIRNSPENTIALSPDDLLHLSNDEIDKIIENVAVFYRVSPEFKMQIVQSFQRRGHIVAMTGDGVNDAPALKRANIGISMGIAGTDVAKEASEMILLDDNFATITVAIEEGKSIYNNIKNFLRFQLTTSIATLSMIAASTLFGLPLPLNPIQILWINIIMDGPPAQSLGLEPLDRDVMNQPPRRAKDPIFTKQLLVSIIGTAVLMVMGTLGTFYMELNDETDDPEYNVKRASTISFTTFVMFQMFNAMNCRSATKSIFRIGFFQNKFFIFSVFGSMLMQLAAIYVPLLQMLFETVSLSVSDLLMSTLVASTVIVIDELRKHFYVKENRLSSLTSTSSISLYSPSTPELDWQQQQEEDV